MKEIAREVNGYQAAIKELEQEYYNVIRSHHEEWENVTPKLTTICHFLHQPHGYYNILLYYKWKDKKGKKRETTVGCVGPDGVYLDSWTKRDFKIEIQDYGFKIYRRRSASWDTFENYMNKDNWKKSAK